MKTLNDKLSTTWRDGELIPMEDHQYTQLGKRFRGRVRIYARQHGIPNEETLEQLLKSVLTWADVTWAQYEQYREDTGRCHIRNSLERMPTS